MNRISIAAFFALFSFVLISRSDAEEIKFETADGKLKIVGDGRLLRSQWKAC